MEASIDTEDRHIKSMKNGVAVTEYVRIAGDSGQGTNEKMLKRGEECATYQTHICEGSKDHSENIKIRNFQPTL
jgi:hypothetical protein